MNQTIADELKIRIEKQRAFFNSKEPGLLFFTEYGPTETADPAAVPLIDGQKSLPNFPYTNWPYNYEFIKNHAFDLGVQYVQLAEASGEYHVQLGDDWVPYLWITFGTGADASLITGREDVVFHEGASYPASPTINDWSDLENLKLDLDNFWMQRARDFWRGVESVCPETDCFLVSPFQLRSPLDFANDLRGNTLFYDFYDYPDEVTRLIDFCADCIVRIDQHLRDEFAILRNSPAGTWGTALGTKSIWLNGDPVDMITEDFVQEFNNRAVETLTAYADGIFFHHHSIGQAKAKVVSEIKGLALQEFIQDPNGCRLYEAIDETMIEASLKVPIRLDGNILEYENQEEIMEKLRQGRFIVYAGIGEVGVYDPTTINAYQHELERLRNQSA